MNTDLLGQLAEDIRDHFKCVCDRDGLEDDEDCDCGGDGRDAFGEPLPLNGCWHCQASAALGERPRDCNEEMGHAGNQGRCRDCDIEYLIEHGRCACGWWRTNGLLWPQRPHDLVVHCTWMAL